MDTIIQPATTRAKRGPYRQHSDEFKRTAVARTLVAGASVSPIVRELKINTNQLFSWRKRFSGELPAGGNAPGQLAAVTVVDTPHAPVPAGTLAAATRRSGLLAVDRTRQTLAQIRQAAVIQYALNLWPALMRYCDDGAIEIDNSAAEWALRGIAIDRRNYLFAGADSGASGPLRFTR